MQRTFINWDRPFLPQAAAWLLEQYTVDGFADMHHVRCVTPGARAGRLLLGILARRSDDAGIELIPPEVMTPGALAGSVLEIDVPIATREERILAWLEALRASSPLEIGALLPEAPAEDDLASWLDLARTLETLNEEIAGGDLEFAEVPLKAECLELFAEGDRWRALERVASRYRAALAACGLREPQGEYRAALQSGQYDPTTQIVLLAVTEINALQAKIIETLGIIALVHAPESAADAFDAFGCPDPDAWEAAPISIRDEHIAVAEDPADQAQAALRAIAELDGAYGPDAITIGVADPNLVEPLARAANWAGLDVHDAAGTSLERSAPARFLEAVAERLEDPSFTTLASLLRHPDVEQWQSGRIGFEGDTAGAHFAFLDRYFTERLDPTLRAGREDRRTNSHLLDTIRKSADDLVAPLSGPARGSRARPLAEWCDPILGLLRTVYGDLEQDPSAGADRANVAACLKIRDVLARHASAEDGLQLNMTGAAAIRFLLAGVSGETIAADAGREQVEMLGWLELHLDPAPVLVLAGCVEGHVPEAVQGGLFLPDVLRRVLGLSDNRRRYARDAYLLESIGHSRKHLTVVVGRRDERGEPLAPSRLLLACDDESMLKRVRDLCPDNDDTPAPLSPLGAPACGVRSAFTIPDLPAGVGPPEHMAVTDFRYYLECPYRYALARRLKLKSLTDDANELDALAFGSLAHRILELFGADASIRDVDDVDAIAEWLSGALADEVARQYGPNPLPAVRIQLARLEQRLHAFARVQVGLHRDGWIIESTEFELDEKARLEMGPDPDMPLSGRIDRIDRNEQTGAVRIIDYKTGESARTPFETHHGRRTLPKNAPIEWMDLQLPLYEYLARQSGLGDKIEVGYVVLPRKANEVTFHGARWEPDHLEAAIDRARAVVTDIRASEFEINRQYDKPYDAFGRICQTLTFTDDDEEEEERAS